MQTTAAEKNLTLKLRAFGSIPRLKIMICLGQGAKNVSQLIENCGLSQSAVSQHLAKLKAAGLIICDCKGRERIYSLPDPAVAHVSSFLLAQLQTN